MNDYSVYREFTLEKQIRARDDLINGLVKSNNALQSKNAELREDITMLKAKIEAFPDHEVVNAAALYLVDKNEFHNTYFELDVYEILKEWLDGES